MSELFQGIFKHKKVLVTGSSYGIGLEIAKDFSKAGSVIALNGRDKSKLKKAQ